MLEYKKQLIETGHKLFSEHLNHSHSGNLSVRINDTVLITRTGAQLGFLGYADLVELNIHAENFKNASMEYIVHRSIYRSIRANAVVHCHPPHVITLSLNCDFIRPVDAEGKFYFDSVPVLNVENAIASKEVALRIPELFRDNKVVVVKSHGIFCIGKNLEEAYKYASSLESSAQIILLSDRKN